MSSQEQQPIKITLDAKREQELYGRLDSAQAARYRVRNVDPSHPVNAQDYLNAHRQELNNFLQRTPLRGEVEVGKDLRLRATKGRNLERIPLFKEEGGGRMPRFLGAEYTITNRKRRRT
jgi:hypothetical protein